MNLFKDEKKKKIFQIVMILVLLGLTIYLFYLSTVFNDLKFLPFLAATPFIILTFLVQSLFAKSIAKKKRYKKLRELELDFNLDFEKELETNHGYISRKSEYGKGYFKIIGKTAYKILVITDIVKYLSLKDYDDNAESNIPGLSKCTRFLGIEIFLDYDDATKNKLKDYSMQTKNLYYEAFYYDKEKCKLIEPCFFVPDDIFYSAVKKLKSDLGIFVDELTNIKYKNIKREKKIEKNR